MTFWAWFLFVAVPVVLIAGALAVVFYDRPPKRTSKHRRYRYPCERWVQRTRDWWAWRRARR